MGKRTYTYDGSEWVGLTSTTADLSNYANLNTNQPTFRNVVINGDMKIDQRNNGNSITVAAGAALAYTVDRWYAFCTGSNVTVGRGSGSTNSLPNQFNLAAVGNTGNTGVGFGHRIESLNSFHLAGQTVTLSAMIRTIGPTSVTWAAYYANTTDSFGTLASPTRTLISTGTFTTNTSYNVYNTNLSIPIAATTGIEIVFTTGALLNTQILNITGVQLELGSIATPFERRTTGTELALCQRYYWRWSSGELGANYYTASNLYPPVVCPVEMRIAPVMTISSQSGINVFSNGAARASTVVGQNFSTPRIFGLAITTSAATAGHGANFAPASGQFLEFSAEL
jgi:hypothetical protein